MTTPHEVFREALNSTGDRIAAIRIIRERFGLGLKQAKEVMLQAEGTAASLDEHEGRIADGLEAAFYSQCHTETGKSETAEQPRRGDRE